MTDCAAGSESATNGLPEPEIYTPERIAEFLLNNVLDEDDYWGAIEEVRRMGIAPDSIRHDRPQR